MKLEKQIEDLKRSLASDIGYLIEDLNRLKRDIDNNERPGLGGQLQNTWDFYRKLGMLTALMDVERGYTLVTKD